MLGQGLDIRHFHRGKALQPRDRGNVRNLFDSNDEMPAGMDPGVRERFLAWLSESLRHPETPTVVLVTHHIEEIVPGFANTLVLSRGRVHSSGPTDRVVTRETIEFVYGTRLSRLETLAGRRWPLWG